jgi:hypothetical protein
MKKVCHALELVFKPETVAIGLLGRLAFVGRGDGMLMNPALA